MFLQVGPVAKSSTSGIYSELCRAISQFPLRYAAYRHYRSRGWVVRPGVRYGATFVLYRDHPDAIHGEYCVLVQQPSCAPSWTELQALTRLMIDISKALVLCQVLAAPQKAGADCTTLSYCLNLRVREILLARAVLSPSCKQPEAAKCTYKNGRPVGGVVGGSASAEGS